MIFNLHHTDIIRMIRGISPRNWEDIEKFSQYLFYDYDRHNVSNCKFVPEESSIWLKYTTEELVKKYKELVSNER